jgi:hypothetical protein
LTKVAFVSADAEITSEDSESKEEDLVQKTDHVVKPDTQVKQASLFDPEPPSEEDKNKKDRLSTGDTIEFDV